MEGKNNITLEQVEKLRAHANVSYEEARAALEAAGVKVTNLKEVVLG